MSSLFSRKTIGAAASAAVSVFAAKAGGGAVSPINGPISGDGLAALINGIAPNGEPAQAKADKAAGGGDPARVSYTGGGGIGGWIRSNPILAGAIAIGVGILIWMRLR